MKFLVDAQLPRRIARQLREAGPDAHEVEGLCVNLFSAIRIAENEDRVVVTKDSDFVNSFLMHGKPPKLLLISTGNIRNADFEALFVPLIPTISAELQSNAFVELTRTALITRS